MDGAAARRFESYVALLGEAVGHADRREPLRAYVTGLLLAGERKSIEPMAAKLDPRHVQARHQSLHHFVANAPWDERDVLRIAREHALVELERHAPVGAWVIDDTGIPKKGAHSVGVAHQYCGARGKQDNCQVSVSVSLANRMMSIPCAWRLYLPQVWANDAERRRRAGVPQDLQFRTKWAIALEQIDALLADELPLAPIVSDAGYGVITAFRDALTERGLSYALAITGETSVWAPGSQPLAPKRTAPTGRPPTRYRRAPGHAPISAAALAQGLASKHWRTVRWREGTRGMMSSRFAALRVRAAHRDQRSRPPRAPEWLLIEWPKAESAPTKFTLSSVPESVTLEELVRLVKLRWRIERDFQELKDELGLDHFEGRSWRGFHHHGALCIAAYCFLAAERARLSPPEPVAFLRAARVPKGFRPRGAAATARAT